MNIKGNGSQIWLPFPFYICSSALFSKFVSAGVFNTRYSIKSFQIALYGYFLSEVGRIVEQVHSATYCGRESNANAFCHVCLICVVGYEHVVVACVFCREHGIEFEDGDINLRLGWHYIP